MVSQDSNARNGGLWQLEQTEPKPPLPGKVARRSRDGEVSGRCYVMIPGFLPGLESPPGEATPQALRASSPSRGAKKLFQASSTRKGMAAHTQMKLRFAAPLAEEPKPPHPQGGGDSQCPKDCVPKPPLLGEVARRSRDGEVGGLCYVMIF